MPLIKKVPPRPSETIKIPIASDNSIKKDKHGFMKQWTRFCRQHSLQVLSEPRTVSCLGQSMVRAIRRWVKQWEMRCVRRLTIDLHSACNINAFDRWRSDACLFVTTDEARIQVIILVNKCGLTLSTWWQPYEAEVSIVVTNPTSSTVGQE